MELAKIIINASREGDISTINKIRKHHILSGPLWEQIAEEGAKHGHLNIIQYARRYYAINEEKIGVIALQNGYIDIARRYLSDTPEEDDIEDQSYDQYTRDSYVNEDNWPPGVTASESEEFDDLDY